MTVLNAVKIEIGFTMSNLFITLFCLHLTEETRFAFLSLHRPWLKRPLHNTVVVLVGRISGECLSTLRGCFKP